MIENPGQLKRLTANMHLIMAKFSKDRVVDQLDTPSEAATKPKCPGRHQEEKLPTNASSTATRDTPMPVNPVMDTKILVLQSFRGEASIIGLATSKITEGLPDELRLVIVEAGLEPTLFH
jgi:hypothetical protein